MEQCRLPARTPVFEQLAASQVGRLVEQVDFVDEVVRLFVQVHPMNMDSHGPLFFVRGLGRCLGDDMDFDAEFN